MPPRRSLLTWAFTLLVAVVSAAPGLTGPEAETAASPAESDLQPDQRVTLAGTRVRINGCNALDVYEGPAGLRTVSLRWRRPTSRSAWLQSEFDREVARFDGDLWRAFVELGGGLRQTASGIAVEARATGDVVECGSFELPVLRVDSVLGAFDPRDNQHLDDSAQPLAHGGLDSDDPELTRILQAAQAGRAGRPEVIELSVEGVTDLSLGCPPWALVDSQSVTFDCASRWGFVELRYALPELEPSPKRELIGLLAREGFERLDEPSRSELRALEARAGWLARRGPYRYRGRFTGEVTTHRGTEALFLTPVFVVEGIVVADEAGGS